MVIITVIILSSINLCIDIPIQTSTNWFYTFIRLTDNVYNVLFTIEAVIKIISFGFFVNKLPGVKAYMQNYWNIIDFVVVVVSLIEMMSGSGEDAQNSGLRASDKAKAWDRTWLAN